MGCSFDRIGITIDKKENIKTFVDIFNKELKDDLYWPDNTYLSESDFEDEFGVFTASVEEEPLFAMMENGAQLIDVVHTYLEAVPDCKFSLWYECTFNNCGAIVYTTYEYANHILTIVDKSSEDSYLDYCPECDWSAYDDEDMEDEELCTIDNYDPEKEYICPSCGAVLEWDVCIDTSIMHMINGKLVSVNANEPEDESED
jgi:hypothetical protein